MKQLRLRFASIFVVSWMLLSIAANGLAQCESELMIKKKGKVLKELKISKQLPHSAEYLLAIKASVTGASWQGRIVAGAQRGSSGFNRFC